MKRIFNALVMNGLLLFIICNCFAATPYTLKNNDTIDFGTLDVNWSLLRDDPTYRPKKTMSFLIDIDSSEYHIIRFLPRKISYPEVFQGEFTTNIKGYYRSNFSGIWADETIKVYSANNSVSTSKITLNSSHPERNGSFYLPTGTAKIEISLTFYGLDTGSGGKTEMIQIQSECEDSSSCKKFYNITLKGVIPAPPGMNYWPDFSFYSPPGMSAAPSVTNRTIHDYDYYNYIYNPCYYNYAFPLLSAIGVTFSQDNSKNPYLDVQDKISQYNLDGCYSAWAHALLDRCDKIGQSGPFDDCDNDSVTNYQEYRQNSIPIPDDLVIPPDDQCSSTSYTDSGAWWNRPKTTSDNTLIYTNNNKYQGPDFDDDKIPDWWEWKYFGKKKTNCLDPSNPNCYETNNAIEECSPSGDYDYDGVSNYNEYSGETDPTKCNGNWDEEIFTLSGTYSTALARKTLHEIVSSGSTTISSGAHVDVTSADKVVLKPGFQANKGSFFRAKVLGGGELPYWWRLKYFRCKVDNVDPQGDEDGDGVRNIWEYTLGTDPVYCEKNSQNKTVQDSDKDGWNDAYEINCMQSISFRPGDDADGDGYSNKKECEMGTNPNNPHDPSSLPQSVIKYKYDELGRLKGIKRMGGNN